jgi:hypothetical protein
MKKYLFLALLSFWGVDLFGQSVTINDLTTLSNLSNADAHNYLVLAKGFKKEYTQEVEGRETEHLNKVGGDKNQEKVIVGVGTKLTSGTVLHTVTYTTTTPAHIYHLITQAKKQGLNMKFQGADSVNNIYLFDNDFFHIVMFINRDNTLGSVEIKQKEYLGFD